MEAGPKAEERERLMVLRLENYDERIDRQHRTSLLDSVLDSVLVDEGHPPWAELELRLAEYAGAVRRFSFAGLHPAP